MSTFAKNDPLIIKTSGGVIICGGTVFFIGGKGLLCMHGCLPCWVRVGLTQGYRLSCAVLHALGPESKVVVLRKECCTLRAEEFQSLSAVRQVILILERPGTAPFFIIRIGPRFNNCHVYCRESYFSMASRMAFIANSGCLITGSSQ